MAAMLAVSAGKLRGCEVHSLVGSVSESKASGCAAISLDSAVGKANKFTPIRGTFPSCPATASPPATSSIPPSPLLRNDGIDRLLCIILDAPLPPASAIARLRFLPKENGNPRGLLRPSPDDDGTASPLAGRALLSSSTEKDTLRLLMDDKAVAIVGLAASPTPSAAKAVEDELWTAFSS
ncbi:hypothetical protein HDU67_010442 [Dinochytrium kinnereticum]|nr:hypothetical protein HDU67_010442 [Dinochytrium kinnereticum]